MLSDPSGPVDGKHSVELLLFVPGDRIVWEAARTGAHGDEPKILDTTHTCRSDGTSNGRTDFDQ